MTHIRDYNEKKLSHHYKRKRMRVALVFLSLCALLVFLCLVSLTAGAFDLSISKIFDIVLHGGDGVSSTVIWDIRIPRILSAVATGCALALSGIIVQTLLQNPLASPSTLGISQGAAFGAAFSIVVLQAGSITLGSLKAGDSGSMNVMNIYGVTACAFVGAMLATIVVLMLSKLRSMSAQSIILAGVALSSLFMSGTIFIQYFASEIELASVVFWTFGDVSRVSYSELLLLFAVTIFIFVYYMITRWSFKAMSAGDEGARILGINVDRMRVVGMLSAALAASVATAFCGVIAFMGLIAPHIAKRIVRNDHRYTMPFSCVVGSIILVIADTIGRVVFTGGSLPVGVLTSFMGAPVFLYLLIKGRAFYDRG